MTSSTRRSARTRSKGAPTELAVLGWREWVALPDFGVRTVKAKLDTGARTSSLHAFKLKRFTRDGVDMARFEVHPVQRSDAATVEVEAQVVDEREVRNSGGQAEVRPVVLTTLEMAGARWEIEVTLSRRDEMGFRLLLGRQALRGRAVVDPQTSYASGKKGEARSKRSVRRGSGRAPSEEEE